jgi:hypothetical protein
MNHILTGTTGSLFGESPCPARSLSGNRGRCRFTGQRGLSPTQILPRMPWVPIRPLMHGRDSPGMVVTLDQRYGAECGH